MPLFFSASWTLLHREVVRFIRQKNRIVGALGTPIVFWFFIGSGLQNSVTDAALFSSEAQQGVHYLQYFFPGTIVLIVLFTAIFSTISIIEDRQTGFLQGVLVSPTPRASIVMGKLLGGSILATLQGLIFMLLAPFLGIRFGLTDGILIALVLFLMSFGLTGLGFIFAWALDSTQGFHAIMNLCLMPLWILSGSMFPFSNAPHWLKVVMVVNPLTYSVAALHNGFFGLRPQSHILTSWPACLLMTFIFSALMFAGSLIIVSRKGQPQ